MTHTSDIFGFLNIYKPKGLTSFDVIRILRKVLKIKQIGHTGTLDPMAEGVLPICIGKSTKLIDYLQEDKGYIADIKFGFVSDTYDMEGKVEKSSDEPISEENVKQLLKTFEGKIEQTPPIYSAIKLNGKKLYEYARKGETDIEIPKRTVNITKIELLNFDDETQTAKVNIECSKGTYIRSIVHDLGQNSNRGAVMTKLIRTKSGKFTLEKTIKLEDCTTPDVIVNNLLNPLEVLAYKRSELDDKDLNRAITGQRLLNKGFEENEIVLLTKDEKLVSIAKVVDNSIKVIKVFV